MSWPGGEYTSQQLETVSSFRLRSFRFRDLVNHVSDLLSHILSRGSTHANVHVAAAVIKSQEVTQGGLFL